MNFAADLIHTVDDDAYPEFRTDAIHFWAYLVVGILQRGKPRTPRREKSIRSVWQHLLALAIEEDVRASGAEEKKKNERIAGRQRWTTGRRMRIVGVATEPVCSGKTKRDCVRVWKRKDAFFFFVNSEAKCTRVE
jgi:hypothetical protein